MIFGEEKAGVRPYVNDDEPKSAQISRSFAGSNYFAQLMKVHIQELFL